MGQSRSVAELVGKLADAGRLVDGAATAGLRAGGQIVKTAAQAQLVAAGAGSGRMRGVGPRGARVSVGYDVGADSVRVRMKGPAHLLERDTRPHSIEPLRGEALQFTNGKFRAYVAHHPGTRGKHPWEKALNQSLPLVPKAMERAVTAALVKAFR